MRKHFLILMLTALLPLAAFAADQNITANVKVAGTDGVVYAPVVDGKAPLKYRIIKVMDNNGNGAFKSGEVEVFENGAEMRNITSITIADEVSIPITIGGGAEQTKSFKIVKIDNNGAQAFTGGWGGNSNQLASVTFGANVTTIAANAFNGVNTLTTVTFGGNETEIGAAAFSGTIISALSLPSKLVTIGDNAFKAANSKYPTFEAVAVPASVQFIGASAFEGCENLYDVTFGGNSKLESIGNGAFAYTSLVALDLSNVKAWKVNNVNHGFYTFGDGGAYGPFTSAEHSMTSLVMSVTLPDACTTVAASALKNVQYLSEINLQKVKVIDDEAFWGCKELTLVQIGTALAANDATGIAIGSNAFYDCSKLAAVGVGTIKTGVIADDAFGVAGHYAGVKTFTFNTILNPLGITAWNLSSVNALEFNAQLKAANLVPAGSFTNAFTTGGTVAYNVTPTTYPIVLGINAAAFSADPAAARTITMSTHTAIAQAYGAADAINKVTINGDFSGDFVIGNASKKLVKDKNSSNYYYYYNNASAINSIVINKKNGENEADVAVYQVYTDATDALNIYFMPLAVVGGQYVIAPNSVVIIKSNKEDGVVATPDAGAIPTMMYNVLGVPVNELKITLQAYSKLGVMSDANLLANGTKELYFFNNPASSGFGFTKYNNSAQNGLAINTVYLQTDPIAADRVNMIWLDENGNTTAIETIENKAEILNNSVMYNVAGQKVGADYKGMVIKNGKKFIQK